jgi:hypothetical protein
VLQNEEAFEDGINENETEDVIKHGIEKLGI